MVKREVLIVAVIILVTAGFIMRPQKNDNTNAIKTQSEKKGELVISDVWWMINDEKVQEINIGDVVTCNIEIIAVNGKASGTIDVIVKNDRALAVDTERSKQTFSISLEDGQSHVIEKIFTTSDIDDEKQQGFLVSIEGDVSWAMEDSYPPRLLLLQEPESSEELTLPASVPEPEPEPEPLPANIVYKSTIASPTSFETGGEVSITVTLENKGDQSGTESVKLYINNDLIETETVTVAGGATKTITFTYTPDSAGTYTAKSDTLTATFTVTEPPVEPEPEPQGFAVINEVEPNPSGTDDGNEWVELYNPSQYSLDIGRWRVLSTHGNTVSVTIPMGTILQPKGYYIVTYSKQWIDNEEEQMVLYDSDYDEVDRTTLMDDTANDGRTHQRIPNGRDTDNSSDWDYRTSTKNKPN